MRSTASGYRVNLNKHCMFQIDRRTTIRCYYTGYIPIYNVVDTVFSGKKFPPNYFNKAVGISVPPIRREGPLGLLCLIALYQI